MNSINMTHSVAQGLRGLGAPANAAALQTGADSETPATNDFASVLKGMLAGVNQSQQHATQLAESFEEGEEQNLAGVMIAQQKAKLTFQSTLQVRNKMVSAYQDIMNMSI